MDSWKSTVKILDVFFYINFNGLFVHFFLVLYPLIVSNGIVISIQQEI